MLSKPLSCYIPGASHATSQIQPHLSCMPSLQAAGPRSLHVFSSLVRLTFFKWRCVRPVKNVDLVRGIQNKAVAIIDHVLRHCSTGDKSQPNRRALQILRFLVAFKYAIMAIIFENMKLDRPPLSAPSVLQNWHF